MQRRAVGLLAAMLSVFLGSGTNAVAKESGPVFDIPRLQNIVVDGKAGDWGANGFRVEALTPVNGGIRPASTLNSRFRLGWDERGLLVLVSVTDDQWTESENLGSLWQADSLEVFYGVKQGVREWLQVLIAPGMDAARSEIRTYFDDHRESPELKKISPTLSAARTKTANGYTLEILLPWSNLAISPAMGREIAFQIVVNDVDGNSDRAQMMWYPEEGAYSDPSKMFPVRLAQSSGEPVRAAVAPDYRDFPRIQLQIIAPREAVGKTAEARDGERALAKVTLANQEGWGVGSLSLPVLARGKSSASVAVLVGGQPAATVVLGNMEAQRQEAFSRAKLVFSPFVFSGEAFPPVAFEQPAAVESMIGPYTLKTTFYDADFNPVKTAAKPGRYGAIVEIEADGKTYKRFTTLFRQAERIRNAREASFTAQIEFPKQFGISPEVMKEQSQTLNAYFREIFFDSLMNQPQTAVLLAGLYETKPGGSTAVRNTAFERDRRWWFALKRKTGDQKLYAHEVRLPPGYDADKSKRWPLLLFLHGAGERGDNLALVRTHGPLKMAAAGMDLPFVIVAPQCPVGEWWMPVQVSALLDEIEAKYRIDPSRIYMTGLSMGGFGSWATATEEPERFAAIAPICGGGDPADAARLKDVPVWNFHGGKDTVVPLQLSEAMVEAVKKAGGSVQFTVYPEAGHDSWTETYKNPKLYEWLLSHRKERTAKKP